MYEIFIKGKYNDIELSTDEIDDIVKEILNQEWVISYEIKEVKKSNIKKLIKERNYDNNKR